MEYFLPSISQFEQHCNDCEVPVSSEAFPGLGMRYNRETEENEYFIKEGWEPPSIFACSGSRWYPSNLLATTVQAGNGYQNRSFALQPVDSAHKFSLEELNKLPSKLSTWDREKQLKYVQIHSARCNEQFHEFVKKVPKASSPKEKKHHLQGATREFYFKLFMVATRNGILLPVQNMSQTYTEVTGKEASAGKAPRPANSFLTFSNCLRAIANSILKNDTQKQLLLRSGLNYQKMFEETGTTTFQNSTLSKALSDYWNTLCLAERQLWDDESKVLMQLHEKQFPQYKYRPQRPVKKENEKPSAPPSLKRTKAVCRKSNKKIKLEPAIAQQQKTDSSTECIQVLGIANSSDALTLSPSNCVFSTFSPTPDSPSTSLSPTPSETRIGTIEVSMEQQFMTGKGSDILDSDSPQTVAPSSPLLSSVAQSVNYVPMPVCLNSQAMVDCSSPPSATWMRDTSSTNLMQGSLSSLLDPFPPLDPDDFAEYKSELYEPSDYNFDSIDCSQLLPLDSVYTSIH